jgi:hypothetical protein
LAFRKLASIVGWWSIAVGASKDLGIDLFVNFSKVREVRGCFCVSIPHFGVFPENKRILKFLKIKKIQKNFCGFSGFSLKERPSLPWGFTQTFAS